MKWTAAAGCLLVLTLLSACHCCVCSHLTDSDSNVTGCEIDTAGRLHLRNATLAESIVKSCLQFYHRTSSSGSSLGVKNSTCNTSSLLLTEVVVGTEACFPSPVLGFGQFQWRVLEPLLAAFRPKFRMECLQDLGTFTEVFANVSHLAGLVIRNNRNLVSIEAFNGLLDVHGELEIVDNCKLEKISGLANLRAVQSYVRLERNIALTELSFPALRTLGSIEGTGAGGSKAFGGDYALVVVDNIRLATLASFSGLSRIAGGTVRIEGNHQLCLPGYPQWSPASVYTRSFGLSASAGSLGVDWRHYFDVSVPCWKYSWPVNGAEMPTLRIRDNGDLTTCSSLTCSSACLSGCWMALNSSLCGRPPQIYTLIPRCPDAAPLTTVSDTPTAKAVVTSGSDDRSADCTVSYWVPEWKMPGVLVFALVVLGAVLILIALAVCFLRWRRRWSRKMGIEEFPSSTPQHSQRRGLELKDTPIAMASFPSSSSKMGSDTGLLLEEEATDLTTYGFDMLSSARSSGDGEEEEEEEEEEGAADGQIYRQNGHYGAVPSMDSAVRSRKALGRAAAWTVYETVFGVHAPVIELRTQPGLTEEESAEFLSYVNSLRHSHENILRLVIDGTEYKPYSACLELCRQGDLKTYLQRNENDKISVLRRGLVVQTACELASAIDYLHAKDIPWRDISTHSCQLQQNLSLKLGDYGLAATTYPNDFYMLHFTEERSVRLPLRWMASEQLCQLMAHNRDDSSSKDENSANKGDIGASLSSNIWSLGITLLEILAFGCLPYQTETDDSVFAHLASGTRGHDAQETSSFAPYHIDNLVVQEFTDCIHKLWEVAQRCLRTSPAERPSASEVLKEISQLRQQFDSEQRQLLSSGPKLQLSRTGQSHESGQLFLSTSGPMSLPASKALGEDPYLKLTPPFSRGLSHPPTSTARSESSPSRHPGYGGLRSALKKPVYPGQVLQPKRRVDFKEGSDLTQVKTIEPVDGDREQRQPGGLRLSNRDTSPKPINPLAQYDHLADMKFDDDDDDDDDDGHGMDNLNSVPHFASGATNINSHLSISSRNYVDTLQRKRKKRGNVAAMLNGIGGSGSRASHDSLVSDNGLLSAPSSDARYHMPNGHSGHSQQQERVAENAAMNDNVMIW